MKTVWKSIIPIAICILYFGTDVIAQSEAPAKLAEFREAFEKTLKSRSEPARDEFNQALESLKSERGASGDYEGAIRARDRQQLLLDDAAAPVDSTIREGEIVVDIESGNRSGSGLKYDSQNGKIIGLSKAKQTIIWKLSQTVPGTYSAIVTYSCGKSVSSDDGSSTKTGGIFTLQEATGLTTTGSEPLERTVESTGGWEKPITRNIGKIKITGSRLSLLLSVKSSGDAGLMHLYGIKLIPESTDSPAVGIDGESQTELETLRQKFLAAISDQTTPTIINYGNALRSLLINTAEQDQARLIQEEFDAAKALSENHSLIYAATANDVATTENDPQIVALENTYRTALDTVRQDLGEKWLDALGNLKDELTRGQNFPQALLVRDEEQRVKELLDTDPLPTSELEVTKAFRLDTSLAKLDGGSVLQANDNTISFPDPGSSAIWELPADLTPGTYEVIVRFRSGKAGGGSYEIEIGDDQKLKGVIAPAADERTAWKQARVALVGECTLDQLTGNLKLTAIENSDTRGLMLLHSIALAPQGTWIDMQSSTEELAEGQAAPEPAREFEKLEDVKWLDKDDRKPGEIAVRHGDKEHTFRLYFVQLPPTEMPKSRSGQAAISRGAKQLGTTEDRLIRFGKKVDAALRDELWTEKFTVYTRWETRGREGSPYAYILLGDTPLSLSLIEQGHARTGGSFASQAPFLEGRKSAKTYMSRLRATEKEAKQAKRGLWGL